MTRCKVLLLAITICVALDFSLPMAPGAFQFALDASVESIQAIVGREVSRVAVPGDNLEAPTSSHVAVAIKEDRAMPRRLPRRRRPVVLRWSRPPHDLPPSSEDPH